MGAVTPHEDARFARVSAGTPKSLPLMVRRALVALLFAAGLVVVGELPAHACKCVSGVGDAIKDADAVFTGQVVAMNEDRQPTTYDVEIDRVYQGDIDTATVQVTDTAGRTSCGLGQEPLGESYAFFVTTAGDTYTVDACSGASRSTERVVSRIEQILGEGRDPVPPAPPSASITLVADEPATLQRLVAPGLALVIVGLLGLVLVSALARRKG